MPKPKDLDLYDNPFGYELRQHRERLRMTQAQLAERLGYAADTISRIETGQVPPSEDFARDCDTFFETHGMMRRLALRVHKGAGLPRWAREWFETEDEAHTLRYWELTVVPGPLQTPDYARELLKMHPGLTEDQIEERITARMERKKILDQDKPPVLWFVFDESVLYKQTGPPKVMHEQLQTLVEAIYHTHVNVQVVPTSTGMHIGNVGSFVIASINGEPDVVYLESARAGRTSNAPNDVQDIVNVWEAIRMKALPDHASLDLVSKVMEQWS